MPVECQACAGTGEVVVHSKKEFRMVMAVCPLCRNRDGSIAKCDECGMGIDGDNPARLVPSGGYCRRVHLTCPVEPEDEAQARVTDASNAAAAFAMRGSADRLDKSAVLFRSRAALYRKFADAILDDRTDDHTRGLLVQLANSHRD